MSLSKRLRYEILRRDNHACRYCGASAPDVKLTVDHVTPEALGGATVAENLVTACVDCNSGKSSSTPDGPVVADVKSDALRWARAMAEAAERLEADQAARDADANAFAEHWDSFARFGRVPPVEANWRSSVAQFRNAGLPMTLVLSCIDKAMARDLPARDVYKYMCGTAWSMIRELQEAAAASLGQPKQAEVGEEDDAYEALSDLVDCWPSEHSFRRAHRLATEELRRRGSAYTERELTIRTALWLATDAVEETEVWAT